MLLPKIVYIETTNKCNARCVMCPHTKMKRPTGFMSQQIFERIIKTMKEFDLQDVRLFLHKEGEPLLDQNIIERISYAKRQLKGLKELVINTNAMLLTESMCVGLLESGLNTIYFSVDGATSQTYNNIRINLDYDTVINNIEKFFLLKKQYKSDIKIVMQMLTNENNYHEADLFRDKWQNEDCEIYIKKMHCYLDGNLSSFQKFKIDKQLNVCEDPFKIIIVYIDGSIGVCCWDYDNEYKIGNIEDDSLLGLFNNKSFNYLRDSQSKKECGSIVPCKRCMRIYGNDRITGIKSTKKCD